jgi:hypothetical protein
MSASPDLREGAGQDGTAGLAAFRTRISRRRDRLANTEIARKWGLPIAVGLSVVIAGLGIGIFAVALARAGVPNFWYRDLEVLLEATRRLFAGESWYLPRQLDGPYPTEFGDVLYPPVAAWFLAPWLLLPAWTFIAPPVAIVAWHIVDARPALWTWPLIAFGLTFPITLVHAAYANPTLWMAAFAALGLRYGWPGALILLKPSLVPFALIGIRTRGWWLCALGLAIASLPFLAETLIYPRVAVDAQGGGLLYSGLVLPFMLVPVVAWLGRRRGSAALR